MTAHLTRALPKRSHLVALAVMAALVAALFSAFGTSQAANLGDCDEAAINYLWVGDTCSLTGITDNLDLTVSDGDDAIVDVGSNEDDDDADDDNRTITAIDVGGTADEPVVVTADTDTYEIVVLAAPEIVFDDTDGIVAAGTKVVVSVKNLAAKTGHISDTISDPDPDAADGSTVSGGYLQLSLPAGLYTLVPQPLASPPLPKREQGANLIRTDGETESSKVTIETTGTPEDDYEITVVILATGIDTDTETDGIQQTRDAAITLTKTLTVGDAGTAVDEVILSLGDRLITDDTDDETGTKSAGESIEVDLTVNNSLGNLANSGKLSQIILSTVPAAGSTSGVSIKNADGDPLATIAHPSATEKNPDLKSKLTFYVSATKPGTVAVNATVIGDAFVAAEELELTFTGPSSSLDLGDASGNLYNQATTAEDDNRDVITFTVSAQDTEENKATIPNWTASVKGPDGKSVTGIDTERRDSAAGVTNAQLRVMATASAGAPLKSGEYTVTIRRGTQTDSSTFNVVGAADSITAEVDDNAPSVIGALVILSVTANDADGNPVADSTEVSVSNSDTDVLSRVGDTSNPRTKGGKASATFAVVGNGHTVLTVVIGTKSTVAVVDSTATAGSSAASTSCGAAGLTSQRVNDFSSWDSSCTGSASVIFAELAARGATSFQLWNGRWIRYSVVDGQMVPGSVDFTVTKGDILFIGG